MCTNVVFSIKFRQTDTHTCVAIWVLCIKLWWKPREWRIMKYCIQQNDDYGITILVLSVSVHKRKMVAVYESKSENLQLNVTFIKCSARGTIEIFLSRNFLHGFFFDGAINMSVLLSVCYTMCVQCAVQRCKRTVR